MTRKIISIVLKSVIVAAVAVGVAIQMAAASASILYFTVQSNIWIGVTCLVGLVFMLAKVPLKRWMYALKYIFTVSITLTGVVYCTMLAPFIESGAFNLSNTLLHVIVPLAAVADFLLYDYPAQFKLLDCLLATVPPFYYLLFAGIGYALNWNFLDGNNYPYFFLNWGSPAGAFGFANESPYMGVLYYVLILLVFVIGMGALFIWLSSVIRKKIQLQK